MYNVNGLLDSVFRERLCKLFQYINNLPIILIWKSIEKQRRMSQKLRFNEKNKQGLYR